MTAPSNRFTRPVRAPERSDQIPVPHAPIPVTPKPIPKPDPPLTDAERADGARRAREAREILRQHAPGATT